MLDVADQAGVDLQEAQLKLANVVSADHLLSGVVDRQLAPEQPQLSQWRPQLLLITTDQPLVELHHQHGSTAPA